MTLLQQGPSGSTITLPDILEAHAASLTPKEISDEELWEIFSRQVRCQGAHVVTPCSVEVTHRITWCSGSLLICTKMAEAKLRERPQVKCARCQKPAEDCWAIEPWG